MTHLKEAVTKRVAVIETEHVGLVPPHAPDHPVNVECGNALAVSVTFVAYGNAAEHANIPVVSQSIPVGVEVTWPPAMRALVEVAVTWRVCEQLVVTPLHATESGPVEHCRFVPLHDTTAPLLHVTWTVQSPVPWGLMVVARSETAGASFALGSGGGPEHDAQATTTAMDATARYMVNLVSGRFVVGSKAYGAVRSPSITRRGDAAGWHDVGRASRLATSELDPALPIRADDRGPGAVVVYRYGGGVREIGRTNLVEPTGAFHGSEREGCRSEVSHSSPRSWVVRSSPMRGLFSYGVGQADAVDGFSETAIDYVPLTLLANNSPFNEYNVVVAFNDNKSPFRIHWAVSTNHGVNWTVHNSTTNVDATFDFPHGLSGPVIGQGHHISQYIADPSLAHTGRPHQIVFTSLVSSDALCPIDQKECGQNGGSDVVMVVSNDGGLHFDQALWLNTNTDCVDEPVSRLDDTPIWCAAPQKLRGHYGYSATRPPTADVHHLTIRARGRIPDGPER